MKRVFEVICEIFNNPWSLCTFARYHLKNSNFIESKRLLNKALRLCASNAKGSQYVYAVFGDCYRYKLNSITTFSFKVTENLHHQ